MLNAVRTLVSALAIWVLATPVLADIRVVIVAANEVPYALGPTNHDNSPTNYNNSSTNYDNSATNYDNSPTNYDNSATNFENTSRRIIGTSGNSVGHYTISSKGVLNLYSGSGRVAFMPSGGHTQSVFASSGNVWCGSVVESNGELVLAMTQSCYMRFLLD